MKYKTCTHSEKNVKHISKILLNILFLLAGFQPWLVLSPTTFKNLVSLLK
jgi:hypothetical protein